MGNLELIVPPDMPVEVAINPSYGNVSHSRAVGAKVDPAKPGLRIVGRVKLGNVSILDALPGETVTDAHRRDHLRGIAIITLIITGGIAACTRSAPSARCGCARGIRRTAGSRGG